MLLWDLFRSAFRALVANRLRTVLTTLGVVIGVAAVITMIALGEGARANVESSIKSMGTNTVYVRPGADQRGPVHGGAVETLTLEDAAALRPLPGVTALSPEVSRNAQAKYLAVNRNTQIVGTTPAYLSVRAFRVREGVFIGEGDVRGRRRVAVLGAEMARVLFNGGGALGERIQIRGLPFIVVGVLEAKGEAGWFNPDEQIVVPVTTAQSVLFGLDHVTGISIQMEDGYPLERLQEDIGRVLRARHRIRADEENDFNIRSQTEMLQRMGEVTGTFTALLGGVAAVSLIVGGIGIMNIMLVSVRERTREIGIRKAVGARSRDILFQFLIEAVAVSMAGGLAGVALGYGISGLIARLANWEVIVPSYAVLLAVVTSAGIGILFGVWPAREAARLDPVEALRYE